MANEQLQTDECESKYLSKGAYNYWGQRLTKRTNLPYADVESIGKVFVYLVNEDGQCVSYKKFNSSYFKDESNEWKFVHLIVDESVGQIKMKRNGGIVQFRCFIRKVERASSSAVTPPFTWPASVDWKPVPMKVRAYIY